MNDTSEQDESVSYNEEDTDHHKMDIESFKCDQQGYQKDMFNQMQFSQESHQFSGNPNKAPKPHMGDQSEPVSNHAPKVVGNKNKNKKNTGMDIE